jgi:hypothetical protein
MLDIPFIPQIDDSSGVDSTVGVCGDAGNERLSFAQGAWTLNFPEEKKTPDTRFWTDRCLKLSKSKLSKEIFNLK